MLGFSSARTCVAHHVSRHIQGSARLGGGTRKRATDSTIGVSSLSSFQTRFKSTAAAQDSTSSSDSTNSSGKSQQQSQQLLSSEDSEFISFPVKAGDEQHPVLLNAQEHAVGYLSKILNARVYDAAIETELQHAKNLSAVRRFYVCL